MVTLDGSTLEGGGQLVRVALSISAIREIPVRITNIRANRASKSGQSSRGRRHGQDQTTTTTTRPGLGRGIEHADKGRGRAKKAGGGLKERAKKAGGGLKESHLAALNWLADKCGADVQGDEVGCCEVQFHPGRRRASRQRSGIASVNVDDNGNDASVNMDDNDNDRINIDNNNNDNDNDNDRIETIELKNPGSVWLVWQAIFPYIVFSMLACPRQRQADIGIVGHSAPVPSSSSFSAPVPSPSSSSSEANAKPAFRIRLKGGTNVPKSPSSEYMQQVFFPVCEKIGLPRVEVDVHRRGWAGSAPEIGVVDICAYHPSCRMSSEGEGLQGGGDTVSTRHNSASMRKQDHDNPCNSNTNSNHNSQSSSVGEVETKNDNESENENEDKNKKENENKNKNKKENENKNKNEKENKKENEKENENENRNKKETETENKNKENDGATQGFQKFRLPPFQIPLAHDTISRITMTIVAGSEQTHTLLATQLATSLRTIPIFSAPSLPITLHPCSGPSGHERRLYVLLVAQTSAGHRLGRDHLGGGRKIGSEADRRRVVAEVVGRVVREFAEECQGRDGEERQGRSLDGRDGPQPACVHVDEFTEDQLVIFQALAEGTTTVHAGGRFGNSLHTRTVRWVCHEMLGSVFDGLGTCWPPCSMV
ncbi:hypothetical protein A1O3_05965 [Capronia epimyces CBS 606.96]|uniref:RNA 3'-terminal phosphate cyclase domain-containing protein n=1 Tax=Capronia epimyces CBS 606.96 TaxID=1182542 RepID=W9Y6N1_9EURO|nr:uncharacterized protein A1O3_05965 [Capronia epimyces CBS 606.96]EXJ85290.1 hypothetical protein A1O3_05965 [Capronia epimyces CBS 606.96]